MKQRHVWNKIGSLVLAVAMVVTSFPAISIEVHADGATEPGQFATKDQLITFDTDDTDGEDSAKLCFGKDDQEWWIAGSQKADSLTLFATSPLATEQQFLVHIFNQNYSTDWGCTYLNEEPERVACKHYGASPIRTTLKELEASRFSTAEQGLMKDTTIYTYDTSRNTIDDNLVYSVTDKLYLAYGYDRDNHNGYITVGENSSDNLDSGLHIDNKYWAEETFWLRTPVAGIGTNVQGAVRGGNFFGTQVTTKMSLVPAFELNLSEVIFASAVKAASSADIQKGTIADEAAMTLRLNGTDKTIGAAVYDVAAGKITAKKAAGAAGTVSLVVQGNDGDGGGDWYYSVPAEETTVVTTDEIQEACGISGEIDLAKCKIWLETTTDRITYAKMAEVNISAEKVAAAKKVVQEALKGLTATNETTKENIQQVLDTALANAGIEDVTVTVGDLTRTEATSHNEGSIRGSIAIECGSEIDRVLVNKTIPATGEVSKDVEKDEKAPNITLSASADELADIILTEGEKAEVENGTNIKFLLDIKDIGDTVGDADKVAVQEALNGNSEVKGFVVGQYLDISLFKIIGVDRNAIFQTARKLTIVIDVPDSLKSKESGKSRTFAIVRVHNGVAETLADLDNDGDTITIATDRFSAYAIVYKQANSGEGIKPTPTPGGNIKPTPTPVPTEKPEKVSDKEKRKTELHSGLNVIQTGKKLQISWGRVTGADGYSVYVQYCGKDFSGKPLKQVKSGNKKKIIVKKINSRKLDTKKNYKLYVVAWQKKNGKKSTLAKTLTIHVAGIDSVKYTNVKSIKGKKTSYALKKGGMVSLRLRAVLYDRRKKQLSAAHTKEFRYLSSNKKIATVTAGGKVKAKGAGICTVYVFAKNGCKRKIKIRVKK